MHYLDKPKVLQFEISSNCNANCIGCSRADPLDKLKLNPLIVKNRFLHIDIFKKIVDADFFKDIKEIQFCGSIDDPPMHPDFLDMLTHLVYNTDKHIIIHTNGSLRKPEYWAEMANILKHAKKYNVNFSIDGLKDTNSIYRRGTDFDKIMENAKAFVAAGGKPQWQWVVFPWNVHQIEEAKVLAKEIGFTRFKERPDTCLDNRDLDKLYEMTELEKKRSQWNWDRYVRSMSDKDYHSGDIYCKTSNDEKAYFVAHTGEIFPCCFLYNVRYQVVHFPEHSKRYEDAYGKNWNNAYYNEIEDIVNGKFFSKDLTQSWKNRNHAGNNPTDCNPICTNTCIKSRRQRWENKHIATDFDSNTVTKTQNRYEL